jgi:hypothetical protein
MTSIFLDEEINENIRELKHSLNLMTPESINVIQNIHVLNTVHSNLIERKKEINSLRDLNPISSDIIDIDAYSDAIGDKIILVENRIQELQNENAGGKRRKTRRRKTRRRKTRRRKTKGSKRRK